MTWRPAPAGTDTPARRIGRAAARALLAGCVLTSFPVLAQGETTAPPPQACGGTDAVSVRAATAMELQLVCDGASAALAFLRRAGLAPPPQTTIELVAEMPGELRGQAMGCYLRDSQRVQLLKLVDFEAVGQWWGEPAGRALYRAAAAHEVAHAAVGCHAEPALPVPAHEYVAYVVMFATMDAALRARLLARYPGRGFASVLEINTIVYLHDPLRFGAESWRHYLKRRDRAAWLRAVVAGDVVQVFPTDGP